MKIKTILNVVLLCALAMLAIVGCKNQKTESKELISSPQELQQVANNTDVEASLAGVWLRSDGTYRIVITEVKDNGTLIAKYFNPNPINVGKSGWRIQNDELQLFVELSDENYPGSFYELTSDAVSGMLSGTYYQAVSKEAYEVSFEKVNNLN